jgi:hypothetical protein
MFHLRNSLIRFIIYPVILSVFLSINLYNAENDSSEFLRLITICILIFFVFMIVRTYFSLKNVFYSNKQIQEAISYTFTNENIYTKGETFEGDFTWNTVYKVKENKDWFLIYQSAQVMNMVQKKHFAKEHILELRNIIKSNKVKAKLRND